MFKLGDVVRLKSGGPPMTITWVGVETEHTQRIHCMWFARQNGDEWESKSGWAGVVSQEFIAAALDADKGD